jgi:multidrug resistance efflux pump
MTGKVDAAAVNSDRAAIEARARMIGQSLPAVRAARFAGSSKLNLSYTNIVAPAAGIVGNKTV